MSQLLYFKGRIFLPKIPKLSSHKRNYFCPMIRIMIAFHLLLSMMIRFEVF